MGSSWLARVCPPVGDPIRDSGLVRFSLSAEMTNQEKGKLVFENITNREVMTHNLKAFMNDVWPRQSQAAASPHVYQHK